MKAVIIPVHFTPRQAALLDQALDEGRYSSLEEIVRDALDLWQQRETARHTEFTRLKRAYDAGMVSGEGRELDAVELLSDLKNLRSSSVF